MHAQAKPERPKGEGHGWPEFYSPQMRGKWWSDIEFSLSRLSTAQTPCLAPTLPCRCNRLSHLRARRESLTSALCAIFHTLFRRSYLSEYRPETKSSLSSPSMSTR